MDAMTTRRKSVALTKEEISGLKKLRSKFLTSIECAAYIGIERGPLDRIMALGRGSEETATAIRQVLQKEVGEDQKV